jgi:hypothetical protein
VRVSPVSDVTDESRLTSCIEVYIGLALDDLASGYIDTETTLRLIALRAWTEGHREVQTSPTSPLRHHAMPQARDQRLVQHQESSTRPRSWPQQAANRGNEWLTADTFEIVTPAR